ncbi:family 16 glycoside hydrolase [Dysgonomonas reticulitermitis]
MLSGSYSFAQDNKKTIISVDAGKVENKIPPLLYGSCIEDVNHEIYGGLYDQRIFGESFEESQALLNFSTYGGSWILEDDYASINAGGGSKAVYDLAEIGDGYVEVDLNFKDTNGENAGILIHVTNPGTGADNFNGYEISLTRDGQKVIIAKHMHNWIHLTDLKTNINPFAWTRLGVRSKGNTIEVYINGVSIGSYTDNDQALLAGKVALRTWRSDANFRNLAIKTATIDSFISLMGKGSLGVSNKWDLIQTGNAIANFKRDSNNPFNAAYSQMIEKTGGKGIVGVSNMGLNRWGIALGQNQAFAGRLYLRGNGNVKIALESEDGLVQYAMKDLGSITTNWEKYEFELISNAKDSKARFTVYMEDNGKVWIDQVVLMGTDADQFNKLPLRKDIAQAMVDQGLTFLRYGGGMIESPEYRFKNMIGNRDKRPIYKGYWYPYTTNGFGIEEFLQFCEVAGFTPSFAINIEEDPNDMADMIEYLNGPVTSEWGKKRAENGHPNPYNIVYLEIGNEAIIWGNNKEGYQHYIERFNLIYDAIKAKDSTIQFINSAWWRPEIEARENMKMVFHALDGKATYWDYHPWMDTYEQALNAEKEIKEMQKLFKEWNPNSTMQCAVFEENGTTHNIERALAHATMLNIVRRMGHFVLATCPANALQPYMQNDNGWDQGQIFFTPSQVWGMPPYYAQQMASLHHKPLRLYNSVSSALLNVTATTDEKKNEVVLHIINRSSENILATLNFSNYNNNPILKKAITLSGPLKEANSPEEPEKYIPVDRTTSIKNALNPDFPGNSYTILVYQRRR